MGKIKNVWFDCTRIFVEMDDQRVFGNPVEWFPNLRKGTPQRWENYIIKGNRRWIHWPELDEDLDVECFSDYTPNAKVLSHKV